MKNDSQKEALKKEEIIPAEDILSDEMAESVEGGKISLCLKGCKSGGSSAQDFGEADNPKIDD